MVKSLKAAVENFKLIDNWRYLAKDGAGFTYFTSTHPKSASRLDRIYCTETAIEQIQETSLRCSFSDHLAVSSRFKISPVKTYSPPYWRFDNFLLEDPQFVQSISTFINHKISSRRENEDLAVWWNSFKLDLKYMIQLYSRQRKTLVTAEMKTLQRQVHEIVSKTCLTQQDLNNIAIVMKRSQDYYRRTSERILLNTGHQQLIEVDRPSVDSRYFRTFKTLEKLHYDGRTITQKTELCTCIRGHFQRKYSQPEQSKLRKDSILYEDLPKLSETDRQMLDEKLTSNDFTAALKSLSKNKSPGIDGLTTEFYTCFWDLIKETFQLVFSEVVERGVMPRSTAKSVTTLVPKKGDLLDIDNWRAISVLNTDYKIFTKALSLRLSSIIGKVIGPDQSFTVPGRSIFDSLHIHRDVIHIANKFNLQLAVLSLDQKAAFDSINHDYLVHILETFNMGTSFINSVKTIYSEARCYIRVGSHLTGEVSLLRGIRQGCPLSGPLFALSIEPLLKLCRRRLSGLSITPNIKLTTTAYADDVSVFITKEADFPVFQLVYDTYANQSGSELNQSKSVGFWTGAWEERSDSPLGFKWTNKSIRVLGIQFSSSITEDTQRAYEDLLKKIAESKTKWRQKLPHSSLIGRKVIINQFIAPKLWHSFQVLPFNVQQVENLQKRLVDIMWDGKHWTTVKDLCLPMKMGGLGLVNLNARLQTFRIVTFTKLIDSSQDLMWKRIMNYLLDTSNHSSISWQWLFVPSRKSHRTCVPTFIESVKEALKASSIQVTNFPGTIEDIRGIPLADSSLIRSCTPPMFSELWQRIGMTTVGSLLDGFSWLSEDVLAEKLEECSQLVKNELLCHFERIKAYFRTHYGNALSTVDGQHEYSVTFKAIANGEIVFGKGTQKLFKDSITMKTFGAEESLLGVWSDDTVHWESYYQKPSLGRDAAIAWRLAKNRLADPVFLHRAGLRTEETCPFCPEVVGTAWHMLLDCPETNCIWSLVGAMVGKILNTRCGLKLRDIYCGFRNRSPAYNLANFLINLSKSSIYQELTDILKEGTPHTPYEERYRRRLRKRILTEFSWYLGKNDVAAFEKIWCVNSVLCGVDGNQLSLML